MSKRVLKFVAFVCVAMMALSLFAGCAGGKSNESAQTASVTTSGSAVSASTVPAEVKKDPITLKIEVKDDNTSFPAGVQTDPVALELAKQTGVTMDIENITQDYNNKISVMLAAGDLPDIVEISDAAQRQQAITSGNIIELTDELMAENAPNYTTDKVGQERIAWAKEFNSNNTGKLYFFNGPGDDSTPLFEPIVGNFVRADLWKAIGYPSFATWEDLLPLLKQMQDVAGKTKDGKQIYAVGAWFADGKGWAEWPIAGIPSFEQYAVYDFIYADWKTTKAIGGKYLDPNSPYIRGLKWFNKAYQMGIFDPESATMKNDQWQEKVNSGQILSVIGCWMDDTANATFAKNGESDKGFALLPPSTDVSQYWIKSPKINDQVDLAISKNCKYPERAIQFLDYLFSWDGAQLIQNGIKGTHWDLVNGKPQFKDEVMNSLLNDPSYKANSGIQKYMIALELRGQNAVDPRYGTPVSLMNAPLYLSKQVTMPFMKEYLAHYNVTYPFELFTSKLSEAQITADRMNPVTTTPEGDIKALQDKVSDYVHNNTAKIIYSKTDAEFQKNLDKWYADLKAMGWDKAEAWGMDDWNAGAQKLDEFLKKINY